MPLNNIQGGFCPLQEIGHTTLYMNKETPRRLSKEEKREILLEQREIRRKTDKMMEETSLLTMEFAARADEIKEIKRSVRHLQKILKDHSSTETDKDWLEEIKRLIDAICTFVNRMIK